MAGREEPRLLVPDAGDVPSESDQCDQRNHDNFSPQEHVGSQGDIRQIRTNPATHLMAPGQGTTKTKSLDGETGILAQSTNSMTRVHPHVNMGVSGNNASKNRPLQTRSEQLTGQPESSRFNMGLQVHSRDELEEYDDSQFVVRERVQWFNGKISYTVPILIPGHWALLFWDALMFVVMLYVAFIIPFRAATFHSSDGPWFWVDVFIDFIFLIDMILTFHTAYWDADHQMITDPKMIARHYLRTWFLVDLIALFPVYLLDGSSVTKTARLTRLSRIAKIFRVLRILKLLKLFHNNRFHGVMNHSSMRVGVRRFLMFIFWTILALHLAACLWMFFPGLNDYDEDTWVYHAGFVDPTTGNVDIPAMYIASLYWATQTMTTVGYGDIEPQSSGERVFATLMMLTGAMFYAFAVSNISSILSSVDAEETLHKRKMDSLNEYMREIHLSKELRFRLRNHFRHYRPNKSRVGAEQKQAILNEMPSSLRWEVAKHVYSENFLEGNEFLNKLPKAMAATLILNSKRLVVDKSHYIITEGEVPNDLYLLKRGDLKVKIAGTKQIAILSTGAHVGDSLFVYTSQPFSVIAHSQCELYFVNKRTLADIMTDYPTQAMEIKQRAQDHISWMMRELKVSLPALSQYGPAAKRRVSKPVGVSATTIFDEEDESATDGGHSDSGDESLKADSWGSNNLATGSPSKELVRLSLASDLNVKPPTAPEEGASLQSLLRRHAAAPQAIAGNELVLAAIAELKDEILRMKTG
eukprot:Clim_evm29s7 gene=Clim_evmTU29s7